MLLWKRTIGLSQAPLIGNPKKKRKRKRKRKRGEEVVVDSVLECRLFDLYIVVI